MFAGPCASHFGLIDGDAQRVLLCRERLQLLFQLADAAYIRLAIRRILRMLKPAAHLFDVTPDFVFAGNQIVTRAHELGRRSGGRRPKFGIPKQRHDGAERVYSLSSSSSSLGMKPSEKSRGVRGR